MILKLTGKILKKPWLIFITGVTVESCEDIDKDQRIIMQARPQWNPKERPSQNQVII
jgi:hypothetical protein